jgi:hypothetical protein
MTPSLNLRAAMPWALAGWDMSDMVKRAGNDFVAVAAIGAILRCRRGIPAPNIAGGEKNKCFSEH